MIEDIVYLVDKNRYGFILVEKPNGLRVKKEMLFTDIFFAHGFLFGINADFRHIPTHQEPSMREALKHGQKVFGVTDIETGYGRYYTGYSDKEIVIKRFAEELKQNYAAFINYRNNITGLWYLYAL